jgi:ABC-type branched-subunit amino acid transport system substrate-binding protein
MHEAGWLNVTESNKILVAGNTADYKVSMDPGINYAFNPQFSTTMSTIAIGWFCKNYPDLTKNYVIAYPDDQRGHIIAESVFPTWGVFGVKPNNVFYPPTAQDLSSLGTKVRTLNPAAFSAEGGGPLSDGLVLKAVYQAGYKGQLFGSMAEPALTLAQVASPDALEGMISTAWPVEFDPAFTKTAQQFKDAWIAKFGKWEGPEILCSGTYSGLRAGLQQAGSTDVDKVASVIFTGMKFEGPTGAGQMISRPDLKNSRTIDSVASINIKQIKGGKPGLFTTIGVDDGLNFFLKANPPSK